MADVEAAGHELAGEEIEGRGVVEIDVGGKIVERLDEAVADELGPDAVDEGLGEEVVAGVGDHSGEFVAEFAGPVDVPVDVQGVAFLFGLGEDRILIGGGIDRVEEGVEGNPTRRPVRFFVQFPAGFLGSGRGRWRGDRISAETKGNFGLTGSRSPSLALSSGGQRTVILSPSVA